MEDESGLELSLGLSFGGSSSKFKVKDAPSDPKGDEGSASRLMGSNVTISDNSFKNFFKPGLENQEPKGKQKSDVITQPQENFFTDLVNRPASMTDCSIDHQNNMAQFARYQEQLISNDRTIATEEEKSGSSKRKLPFEEIKFQNKHEKLVNYVEKQSVKKPPSGTPLLRSSHVSNATEDGSTGENEDVAESEAEGPHSWLVSMREENAKCSDALKFSGKSVLSESGGIGSHLSGKESNPEYGKSTFGTPLSLQPLKVMNIPYPVAATVPPEENGLNTAGFPSTHVMQLMPNAIGERPVAPAGNTKTMQIAFGYPSVQLPTLETGSSWAFNSQPMQISSFTSREMSSGAQIQEHVEDVVKKSQGAAPPNTTATFSYDGKSSDLVIGSTKFVGETAVSARSEDQSKSRNNSMPTNEAMNRPETEGSSREAPVIRPGISPNLRFGGCGTYPNLPWVSTTGQGPNGKTISGVTYKYSQNQIKIVCACHGTHMSPEEFIHHASSEASNLENNPNLASFPTTNTPNSAQS